MNKTIIGTSIMVVIILGAYLFFSSGYWKRNWAVYTGHSTECIDGIRYVQFISGASVKYHIDKENNIVIERCID